MEVKQLPYGEADGKGEIFEIDVTNEPITIKDACVSY